MSLTLELGINNRPVDKFSVTWFLASTDNLGCKKSRLRFFECNKTNSFEKEGKHMQKLVYKKLNISWIER